MHGGAWYVLPSDNLTPSATPTWAVGTPDSDFPLANALTLEPDVVAKANENTATLRFTWGASKTILGFLFINLNFPGVTMVVSNNGGMTNQNVVVPTPEDNLMINAYVDLREVSNNAGTQWNFAVVGSAPVTFGAVIAIEAWSEFRMRWEYDLAERFPVIEHRTGYQKRLQYRIPVRYRKVQGVPFYAADREALRTLRREAQGSIKAWGFLMDTDPMLMQFASDEHAERNVWYDLAHDEDIGQGVIEHPIQLEEVHAGLSLL